MSQLSSVQWDLDNPFIHEIEVNESDTDRLGHTNNRVYLKWMEDISWLHVAPLGMDWQAHEDTQRAMAITRTEIDYLASSYAGDKLILATWITSCDNRLLSSRQFQLVRAFDGKTLIRAKSFYACIDLKNGKPARMPKLFIDVHKQAMLAHNLINE